MKDRKGSTLVLSLIVSAILMILGTAILGFMVNENKVSLHHQYKTQAYYVARSGAEVVEAAIMDLDELEINLLNYELNKGPIQVQEIEVDEDKAKIVLRKDMDKLIIESTGIIGTVEDNVTKIMIKEESTSNAKIEYTIFSLGNVNINNGIIEGDIGTNKSVNITGNPKLNGDTYLLEGYNISAEKWWKDNWIKNYSTMNLWEEKNYEPLKFLKFPINNSNLNFVQGGADKTTITRSEEYNKFEINSNTVVYIDTSQNDIVLNIKQFNLNNGHIAVIGTNKLTFYVENMVTGSGSTINYKETNNNNKFIFNEPGDPTQVNIYHNGASKLSIAGAVKIAGNLYIEKAHLDMGGSGGIMGSVYSNGGSISLTGNSDITKGLIYAPNAHIDFTGSGKAYGAIIGKTVTLTGGGSVIFAPEYIDTSLIDSFDNTTLQFKPGYFK